MLDDIGSEAAARRRAYYKNWYARNRDRKLAQVKAYRQSGQGKAARRAHFERNKVRINALARGRERAPRPLESSLLHRAKHRAKRGGVPFAISLSDIVVPARCPVLGMKLHLGARKAGASSPSLDRIVPSRGYVPGNVAVISWRANLLKTDGTAEEHRKIAEYIEAHGAR